MSSRPRTFLAAALCLAFLAPAIAGADDWQKELGDWRRDRFERLTSPDGWLTLVGLFWLQEGANRLGSSRGNEMAIPSGPTLLGTVELARGATTALTFVAAPGAAVHLRGADGKPGAKVDRIALVTDAAGKPTVLESGPISWFVIERSGRLALRVKDREASTRKEFVGLESFPAGPDWRLAARLEAAAAGATIQVPNVVGTMEPTPTAGHLVFTLGGKEHRLATIAEPGSDELFVVFGDATNGKETYGGGRFLSVAKPGADGRTTVDFNRAYNPPCAFTPYATCPLPPAANKLPVAIEAGERFAGAH